MLASKNALHSQVDDLQTQNNTLEGELRDVSQDAAKHRDLYKKYKGKWGTTERDLKDSEDAKKRLNRILASPISTAKHISEQAFPGQWKCMNRLLQKESGGRPHAQNPTSTAFGMYQFLNSTWKMTGYKKSSNHVTQVKAGVVYIKKVYRTPCRAVAFHNSHNWY